MSAKLPLTFEDVEAAARIVAGHVLHTPLLHAPRLSQLTGANIVVKYETLQVTNAFKERGAVSRLMRLSPNERRRGVVTLSAGNHAQALACHAQRLGIPATIVMPRTTPFLKVANTENFGARVVLDGETIAECSTVVDRLIETDGLVLVHPYDDPLVMAGQGTVALEMLDNDPDLECLVVPIGGGGLISGIATVAKAINPDIEIVGVQSALYPAMMSARNGQTARCGGDTLAEGIAVKNVSASALAIVRELVGEVLAVEESDIERAIYAYLIHQKTLAEGAGAAGLAAVLANPARFEGRRVGLVLTGGNIDPRMLSAITVRALERDDHIVALRVTLRDRPGELARVSAILGREGANILEVSHQRMLLDVPAMRVTADITMETRDGRHAERIVATLQDEGMTVARLDPMTRSTA